ncbi:MAG: AI-2E family transporter [Anaerolineae bacterium]|nr:AI-2E family transporter [Anaerolineae bacterium]
MARKKQSPPAASAKPAPPPPPTSAVVPIAPPPRSPGESPPWDRTTKTVVVIIGLLLLVLVTYRFQSLIGQVVAAAMLAYVLNPLIKFLDERTPLHRNTAILLVYLAVAALFLWAVVALGVAAYQQVITLIEEAPTIITNFLNWLNEFTSEPILIGPVTINPTTIDWTAVRDQLLGMIQPALSQGGRVLGSVATSTVTFFGSAFFVFIVSIYLAIELPKLGEYVGRFAHQPGYRQDAERVMREFGRIWSAYLRGQIILGLIIGAMVWIAMLALGVRNAFALGVIAGLLEFIPNVGPIISAVIAVIVAVFQPTNYLGLSPGYYALAVIAVMIVIQQVENSFLVPRIVGEALDLHPLIVIVGVFMGGSLAGITGAILAAPVLASIKLLGTYAWRKLFDLPPFPNPEDDHEEKINWRDRGRKLSQAIFGRFRK